MLTRLRFVLVEEAYFGIGMTLIASGVRVGMPVVAMGTSMNVCGAEAEAVGAAHEPLTHGPDAQAGADWATHFRLGHSVVTTFLSNTRFANGPSHCKHGTAHGTAHGCSHDLL
jgi:hypothetical protein